MSRSSSKVLSVFFHNTWTCYQCVICLPCAQEPRCSYCQAKRCTSCQCPRKVSWSVDGRQALKVCERSCIALRQRMLFFVRRVCRACCSVTPVRYNSRDHCGAFGFVAAGPPCSSAKDVDHASLYSCRIIQFSVLTLQSALREKAKTLVGASPPSSAGNPQPYS